MIHFDPTLGWWSPAVFWYVCVSVVLCILFCIVVFIGGWFDLMFLLRSLDEVDADPETKSTSEDR